MSDEGDGGPSSPTALAWEPASGFDIGEVDRWQVRRCPPAFPAIPWPDPTRPTVCFVVPASPLLVLGSTQPASGVDAGRAAAAGVAVVRRASGGGAVLVRPGEVVWVDVGVPAGDALWSADVGRAFAWLGEVWAEAVRALGLPDVRVHQGPLVRSRWSGMACFAGLGPGEVTTGGGSGRSGRKVVGLCQRRTRAGSWFQGAALLRWDALALADLLVFDDESARAAAAADLAGAATGMEERAPAADRPTVEAAFLEALAGR